MCVFGFNEIKFLLWIQENMRSDFMDLAMKFISKIGDVGMIWIIFGLIFLAFSGHRKMGINILLSLFFSFIICNLILKNYVSRIRPYEVYPYIDLIIEKQKDFSFPSGHTSASFASALVILKSNFIYKKFNMAYLFIILAVLMSFSRMYLFVHYPTDIIGGIITGMISAEISYVIIKNIYDKFGKRASITQK